MPTALPGLLQKVMILAFDNSKDADFGSINTAKGVYKASVNPENYSQNYSVLHAQADQAAGTSGKALKYFFTPPSDLKLEFLFDGTGVIENSIGGAFGEAGVYAELTYFRNLLIGYVGGIHKPYCLVVVWGPMIFKGYATSVDIKYKLFNSSGIPIRATASVTFSKSIEDAKRAALDKPGSPDITHVLRVKAGDTLPLMCKKVYGDPRYYLQVAEANKLGNFRQLEPGMEIIFPPLDKTTS